MTRSLRMLLVLALALATLMTAASADEHGDDGAPEDCDVLLDEEDNVVATFCTDQVWFTESTAKAGNLAVLGASDFPSWDREAPTASVTEGAGGGYHGNPYVDIVEERSPEAGATFEGTLRGDIDALALDLYMFLPFETLLGTGDHSFRAEIIVDGRPAVMHGEHVTATVEATGDTGEVYRMRVAFTDLFDMLGGVEDPETEREAYINVTPWFLNSDEAIYVYDTVEVPSTLIVNPDEETLADFEELRRF